MKKLKSLKSVLKNNRGQGMVEYILILVVVVAIVLAAKEPLLKYVKGDLMDKLTNATSQVTPN